MFSFLICPPTPKARRRMRFQSLILALLFSTLLVSSASAQRFNCSSNGQRQECQIPARGNRNDLHLVRQYSQQPCIEGQTWGRRGNRVWVDRGCRADFELGQVNYDNAGRGDDDRDRDHDHDNDRDRRGGPGWDQPPAYYAGSFSDGHSHCSSAPGAGRTYCQSGGPFQFANPLRVNNMCAQNRTWGVSQYGLWVSNGCAGEWEIKRNGGVQGGSGYQTGPGWDRPPAYYAGNFSDGHSHCSAAPGPGRTYCQSGGAFRYANPLNMNNMCVQNRTWGVSQYGLWVSNGCSGEWEIKR